MDCLDQLDVCDGNVVIKKYVEVGEERYSILLFGGEHKFFTNTHMDIWSRHRLKELSKEIHSLRT